MNNVQIDVTDLSTHNRRGFYMQLYLFFFYLYVGTGPVYWLPWIPQPYVELFKTTLFFIVVIVPLFSLKRYRNFSFPGGTRVLILFLAFFFLSIPSILQGEPLDGLRRLQNTAQILLFLNACEFLISNNLITLGARRATIVAFLFCLISLIFIIIIPDHPNPLNEQLSILHTGLGGSRTGWSPSIALYLPWLYSILGGSLFFSILAGFTVLGNQALVAGRTGMVAAAIPFVIWGFIARRTKIFIFVLAASSLAALYISLNLEELRFNQGDFKSIDALNELSTGRIEQYIVAIMAIIENPFVGYGAGDLFYEESHWYIHNVFLKLATEGGVAYGLVSYFIIAIALFRGWRGLRRGSSVHMAAFLTVLTGAITAQFEPGAMFGAFNQIVFWWACFAICVSKKLLNGS